MSDYTIEMATKKDDSNIKNLLSNNPMPGHISFTTETNPSFFKSLKIKGKTHKVIIAKYKSKKIVGFGVLSKQKIFINKKIKTAEYLSALRIDKNHRKKGILSKSMKYITKLNLKNNTTIYYTFIVNKNKVAKKIFLSNKKNFPKFNNLGEINTHILFLNTKKYKNRDGFQTNSKIELANINDAKIIEQFMNKYGKSKQFFPKIEHETIEQDIKLYDKSYFLIYKNKELSGVFSIWDQSKIKQIVIKKYSFFMNLYKKAHNIYAYLFDKKKFPEINNIFRYFYLSDLVIKDNNQNILKEILNYVLEEYSQTKFKEYNCIMFALHEKDELNKVLKKYKKITYKSSMYEVNWKNKKHLFKNENSNNIYVDISKV